MILNNGKATLNLPAKVEALSLLTEWMEGVLKEISFDTHSGQQVLICVDEIATNITAYAYPIGDGDMSVSVKFNSNQKELEVIFTDSGIPFDPLSHKAKEVSVPAEQRSAGGLGILVIKQMMDHVAYCRTKGCNVLTIIKRSTD